MTEEVLKFENCESGIYILTVIVDNGKGSRVLKLCRQVGVGGGTICLGEGTVGRSMFTWIDYPTVKKEIVIMAVTGLQASNALNVLQTKLKLNKPGHGIAFRIALDNLFGSSRCASSDENERIDIMAEDKHKAIFVIVDRGNAETVIEAAEEAGARGATVINARGAGTHETSKLFAMVVEPEKEVVLIVAAMERTDSITTAIRAVSGLDKPGKGIMFVVDVEQTVGLY
jgi:nitrogen regulatory protein PII